LLLLLVLSVGVSGIVLSRPGASGSAATLTYVAPSEPVRITPVQQETFAFFNDGRAAPSSGRGLFETDFFKPAPAPPKPVVKPPPPPPPRNLAVVYRGLAAFPGGTSVAYVAVDGRVLTLSAGEAVAEGWTLLEFDSAQAVLAKGQERFTLPFNRTSAVPANAKP
jgi:hypothetical protein